MSAVQSKIKPIVGAWYEDSLARRFEVVAIDAEAGRIEVQYEDGKSGELDLAEWRHAMTERVGSPYELMTSPDEDDEEG